MEKNMYQIKFDRNLLIYFIVDSTQSTLPANIFVLARYVPSPYVFFFVFIFVIWWRWWKCFLLAAGKKAAEDEHEHTYKNALYVIIVSSKFNDEIGESRQKSNQQSIRRNAKAKLCHGKRNSVRRKRIFLFLARIIYKKNRRSKLGKKAKVPNGERKKYTTAIRCGWEKTALLREMFSAASQIR